MQTYKTGKADWLTRQTEQCLHPPSNTNQSPINHPSIIPRSKRGDTEVREGERADHRHRRQVAVEPVDRFQRLVGTSRVDVEDELRLGDAYPLVKDLWWEKGGGGLVGK